MAKPCRAILGWAYKDALVAALCAKPINLPTTALRLVGCLEGVTCILPQAGFDVIVKRVPSTLFMRLFMSDFEDGKGNAENVMTLSFEFSLKLSTYVPCLN